MLAPLQGGQGAVCFVVGLHAALGTLQPVLYWRRLRRWGQVYSEKKTAQEDGRESGVQRISTVDAQFLFVPNSQFTLLHRRVSCPKCLSDVKHMPFADKWVCEPSHCSVSCTCRKHSSTDGVAIYSRTRLVNVTHVCSFADEMQQSCIYRY